MGAGMLDIDKTIDDTQKQCKKCLLVKDRSLFFKHTRAADGLSGKCKECDKAKTYAYRAANPGVHAKIQAKYRAENREAQLAATRKWAVAHPEYERARYRRRRQDPQQVEKMRAATQRHVSIRRLLASAENSLTTEQVLWLRSQPCAYCMNPGRELDHVVPVSCGGSHTFDNVVTSCRTCNAKKGNKSLLHFLLTQKRDRTEVKNGSL